MELLNRIRKPNRKTPLFKAVVHTALLFCLGLIVGAIIKLLDIYTTNLGNIFSQMSVWVFLCTLISIYSSTAGRGAVNVFCFCFGMLSAYYVTAEMTESVYSHIFVYGWAVFALFSPLMGFCVWYAKGKSWISKIITAGIIILTLAAAIVLFDKIRISDIGFVILTGLALLKNKDS